VTYGDVNSDGKISILDIIALKSYILEKNTDGFSVKAADLDGDGTVSAKDAVELSMFLLNQTGSFSCEMNIDTDGDGLCDYIEKEILGTDYLKKDTDGDGLDDYSEVYLCDTDPLNTDTGKTGVKDSAKDADGDKLTNAEEITLGTSPALVDTDEDGLSDYDEVKKYKTNPLKEDTDGDGISDNGEIKLGLDPLKVKSDGKTSDAERTFEQKLSSDSDMLKIVNNEDSPYQLSISAKSSGYINEAVSVDISAYSNYLQNDAVAGDIIDIDYADEFTIESLKISFSVPENAERYFIFRYSEDVNMLLPVETLYDENEIYTECSEDGTYCIVDMDMWISNSAEPEEIQSANVLYNAVYASESKALDSIEVYFLIYIKGTTRIESARNSVASASRTIIDYCKNNGKDIKIYFASYTGATVVSKVTGNSYVDSSSSDDEINEMLSKVSAASGALDTTDFNFSLTRALKKNLLEASGINEKSKKYCFVVDVNFQPQSAANVAVVEEMKKNGVDFTFICNDLNDNIYNYEILSSSGSHIKWTPDFSENIISKVIGNVVTYNVNTGLSNEIPYDIELITSEWKDAYEKYSLGKLSDDDIKKIGLPDSDGDGVYDFIEINMKLISFDESGNLILPTYEQMVKAVLNDNILGLQGLIQLVKSKSENNIDISSMRILPILSNPTLKDSDFDGIDDKYDDKATRLNKIDIEDKILDDTYVFSPLPLNYNVKNYFKTNFENTENSASYKYFYKNTIESNVGFIEDYYIVPEDNSDYILEINSNLNDDVSYTIRRYEINRNGTRKPTSVVFDQRLAIDGKIGFSLEKDHKYEFLIQIITSDNSMQKFTTILQQDNWTYIPEGCIVTGKHTEDLYLCDDALKVIADRDGQSVLRKSQWEENKKMTDFSGCLAENITETIYARYMRYMLNLTDRDNYIFELSGDMSTAATYGGLLSMPVKALSPVGTALTVVGAVSTYISSYGVSENEFESELKRCLNSIKLRSDKSVIIKHEKYYGERVNVEPWINKYVCKYNEKGEKLTINAFAGK